jgi:PrtD family type I secretion system ABC transporter
VVAQPDPAQNPRPGQSEIRAAILASKPAFIGIGLFSLVINVLMLAGPLFMLQVYDRVMTSGSIPTLVALSVLTALLYGMIGLFELIRTRVIARVGVEIDQRLSSRILKASLRRSLLKQGASVTALRELDNVRQFVSGPAPMVFFDAPWTPIYLLVIFCVHWALGVAAAIGAVLILVLALMSERTSRQPLSESNMAATVSLDMADSAQRNVEALAAMGMVEAFRKRWQKANGEALAWQIMASDKLGSTASLSKAVRLLLQSMMLAIGAALAINGLISAGSIIAGTIIFGRALAPVEQAVGQWRSFVKARESFGRLEQLLRDEPEPPAKTALPAPKGYLEISQLRVAAPDTKRLILANLNFVVTPGQLLAVIGPSASGKSTLARTLVGIWPPFSGTIRIDGAQLGQWSQEDLGQYIGYLPQDVELFAGTVRDNICRFRDGASDAAVIEAAMMAHAHEMILALPKGYDTQLGSFGTYLSAGQRQRIGLARALFGHPALVVLDEPNANLDRLGDEALTSALAGMKKRGQAVIMISHRVQAIGLADTLLYLDRGVQRAFGPRAEVMKLFQQPDAGLQNAQPTSGSQPARSSQPVRPGDGGATQSPKGSP